MTKKAKRTVSMLLAGMLTLYSAAPVAAVDSMNADANAVLTSADKAALFDVLDYVESQKELFGLGDVDFSELAIGNPISTYEYLETGLEECTPIYPLFYDGEVVAIAKCPEETYFQISTGLLVDELNNAANDSVSLVYDADGIHMYDGAAFTYIAESTFKNVSRQSLAINSNLSNVNTISLSKENASTVMDGINLTTIEDVTLLEYVPTSAITNYYSYSVDYIEQTETMNCWAACIACISNAVKGTSLTCDDVVEKVADEYNMNPSALATAGRDPALYAEDMRELFYLLHYYNRSAVPGYADVPAEELILYGIQHYRPSIGNFYWYEETEERFNHSAVICGIHLDSDYLTLMDPARSGGGFHTAFYHNGYYSYTDNEDYTRKMDKGVHYIPS